MCIKKSNQYKVLYYKLYIGCFDIFKLNIQSGRLVKGFGKAYDITICDDQLIISEGSVMGHKMK